MYSYACSYDVVLYKCLFANKEINSTTTATTENNGKSSKQTCSAPTASTKNLRNSKASPAATSTSKEETRYLRHGLFKIFICHEGARRKDKKEGNHTPCFAS
jgi:hypothetical protein